MYKQHTNTKPWSWTEAEHRRHSYGRYRHINLKPMGVGKLWNSRQRQFNKRQLERLTSGYAEEVEFFDRTRHMGIWDLW